MTIGQPTAIPVSEPSLTPHIAVILCAYTEERWADLMAAIESLRAQTRLPDEIVLVIDHNAALLEKARALGSMNGGQSPLTVIENHEAKGLSGARNSGIAATQADLIGFLDDDAAAAPDWLERMLHALDAHPRALGVSGWVVPQWAGRAPRWLPEEFLLGGRVYTSWAADNDCRGAQFDRGEYVDLPKRVRAGGRVSQRNWADRGDPAGLRGNGTVYPCPPADSEVHISDRAGCAGFLIMYRLSERSGVTSDHAAMRKGFRRQLCPASSVRVMRCPVNALIRSKTLPLGVLRGLQDTLTGRDRMGIVRSAAILMGLGLTAIGYLRGKTSGIKPCSHSRQSSAQNLDGERALLPVHRWHRNPCL
ncbi:MAG: glycosyltransferase family 2 protein [Anaerolineae bacterium]